MEPIEKHYLNTVHKEYLFFSEIEVTDDPNGPIVKERRYHTFLFTAPQCFLCIWVYIY